MVKILIMELGEFLKRYRKAMQYSGRLLAEKIGVSKHLLEKWENSNYTPNAADTEKIKKFFGLKTLENLTEEVLEKCIAGRNISAEEKLKEKDAIIREKEKRIRDLERIVAQQEEMLRLVKGTNLVGKTLIL